MLKLQITHVLRPKRRLVKRPSWDGNLASYTLTYPAGVTIQWVDTTTVQILVGENTPPHVHRNVVNITVETLP